MEGERLTVDVHLVRELYGEVEDKEPEYTYSNMQIIRDINERYGRMWQFNHHIPPVLAYRPIPSKNISIVSKEPDSMAKSLDEIEEEIKNLHRR